MVSRLSKQHTYLHEEAGQQCSLDAVGVGLCAEGRLGDGKLDPLQDVSQLGPDGVGRLEGALVEEAVPTPLLITRVCENIGFLFNTFGLTKPATTEQALSQSLPL